MSNKFKQQTKWLFLVLGLLFVQHSFAYKSTLTRQIAGEDGTDARIEEV
jgi:hypothetical protein